MKTLKLNLLMVSLIFVATGCASHQPVSSGNSTTTALTQSGLSPERKAYLAQKKIFERAQFAPERRSFYGAAVLLVQIKDEDIIDPDLANYVALSRRIAAFNAQLGVPPNSNSTLASNVKWMNYRTALYYVTLRGVPNAPTEATRLMGEAVKIRMQLSSYDDLNQKLRRKYADN